LATHKIRFLDLRVQQQEKRAVYIRLINDILENGPIVSGTYVKELEKVIAAHCKRKHAFAVNSGTSALYISLKSLGIKRNDEVIIPCISWIATANVVNLIGATPVFADVRDDLNICSSSIEALINKNTKAIIAVDFTGRVFETKKIQSICNKYGISLIEDAAQAFGAKRDQKPAGSFGLISCFSMNSVKILSGFGEAGMILTNDDKLAAKFSYLRESGMIDRLDCVEPSMNFRMDTIQAAMILEKYKDIESVISLRRKNASFYDKYLSKFVTCPTEAIYEHNVYYTYTILTRKRDELKLFLEQKGIETQIQHNKLMCEHPAYKKNMKHDQNSKELVKKILSIPIHEKLSLEQICFVKDQIIDFFEQTGDNYE